jgi:hypothetical protein
MNKVKNKEYFSSGHGWVMILEDCEKRRNIEFLFQEFW